MYSTTGYECEKEGEGEGEGERERGSWRVAVRKAPTNEKPRRVAVGNDVTHVSSLPEVWYCQGSRVRRTVQW